MACCIALASTISICRIAGITKNAAIILFARTVFTVFITLKTTTIFQVKIILALGTTISGTVGACVTVGVRTFTTTLFINKVSTYALSAAVVYITLAIGTICITILAFIAVNVFAIATLGALGTNNVEMLGSIAGRATILTALRTMCTKAAARFAFFAVEVIASIALAVFASFL
jgi:hypothetical protein